MKIIDIDGDMDVKIGESYHPYIIKFDDGSSHEGFTSEDGIGDGECDHIAHLRIGDEYECLNDFIKDIRGE